MLNPTLPDMETSSLDLIVCGTPDAITMVEAGAKQVAEDVDPRGAGAGPRGHPPPLRRAGRAAGEGRQAEVVRPERQGRSRVSATARSSTPRSPRTAWPASPRPSPRCSPPSSPASPPTPARTSWCAATRCALAAGFIADERRAAARQARRRRAVRRRDPRAVRRRAGLQGAQVGEALGADRVACSAGIKLPVPGRRRRRRPRRRHGRRGQGRGRLRLQADRAHQDRGRQAPPRRPLRDRDPPDHVRRGPDPARARLGALHPRADAGADACHARHGEGGAAHRRPVAADDEALHPPLQLPALLRRRDRLHAGPEAARHRPRCARRARHPARSCPRRTSSRTRCAWSPRSWSPTARRRWPRSAAPRWPCSTPASASRAPSRASRWASSRRATTSSS